MPVFQYEGRERTGKKVRGKIEANAKASAITELKQQGVLVLSMKEEVKGLLDRNIELGRPVKGKDIVIFLRQFATLIRAGIGIVESIQVLGLQTENKKLQRYLSDVQADLQQGTQLSDACAKYPKVFEPLFISMIRAGEASGNMELVLERLATFYEKAHYTKEKVKSAMAYPVTVGLLAVAVTVYLLTNIVPTFVGMFSGLHAELPEMTKVVMAFSKSLIDTWYFYLIGLLVLVVIINIIVNNSYGRFWVDYGMLKMPVFGKLLQKSAIARMTRTLATLFSSSVPILQSLSIVEGVVGNRLIGDAVGQAKESLRQGRPLSEPFKKSWVIPPMVSHMIAVGEETGSLDSMLDKVADFYEKEVESSVDKIKSLIEPIMIVFLSGIVGTIVLSIMVPMFDIFSKVK
ncbi:type II secretion system F family protein [Brevibacillus sp. GCM10020057]|uniref:type II secretion system F family protein n=1 Tax=Brevibacillus sp. GCM10020057 TaxID=3317327 RepID=UPI003644F179